LIHGFAFEIFNLTIDLNFMPQTIEEVITNLEHIVKEAEAHGSRLGYFASLYLNMTRAVKKAIRENKFKDNKRMEKLCILFASRYLDALNQWKSGIKPTNAWHLAFEQTKLNSMSVIQHILCGINAHINLDLGIAAAQTCPGNQIHDLKGDFEMINKVIGSLVDKTQEKLEKISWPMRWLDRIGQQYDENIANFSIGVARDASWISALTLAAMTPTEQKNYIIQLDLKTTALGNLIVKPGAVANLILKPVKWFEPKNPAPIIRILSAP